MRILYDSRLKVQHKGKSETYRVRIIDAPTQDDNGKINKTSDFARKLIFDWYMTLVLPNDTFFELEEDVESNRRKYLSMLLDEGGFLKEGRFYVPDYAVGCLLTTSTAKELFPIQEIMNNLPFNLEGRIFGLRLPRDRIDEFRDVIACITIGERVRMGMKILKEVNLGK